MLSAIVAAFALIGFVMFGLVIFLVIAALAAVAGIVIWARVWWLKRRLGKEGFHPRENQHSGPTGQVIDAEYTVVEESTEPPDRQR
jgi:hypothetical protein